MLRSPFKSVIARTAIFALVLSLGIAFVSVGFNPTASAQSLADACDTDDDGVLVSCDFDYDENGTDSVADFSAMDPEGEGIGWALEGADASAFDITGGVLTFKDSPNFEMPDDVVQPDDTATTEVDESAVADDNIYEITVRATENLAADQEPPAKSATVVITVTVKDVNEAGTISLNRLQPQTGTELTASYMDPDRGQANATDPTNVTWLWSVPKVSRPVIDNDSHWTPAGAAGDVDDAPYTPIAANEDKVLRVKVTYNDAQSTTELRTLYMLSYYAVRAEPTGTNNAPAYDETTISFSIPEDAPVGTVVGTPVTATDADSGDIISYVLTAAGASDDKFEVDIRTGQISVAAPLNHEDAGLTDGAYTVTITAYDPSDETGANRAATVTITATDVNEAPTVTGNATGTIGEIDSTPDTDPYEYTEFESDAYTRNDVDDGDNADLEWSLAGDDAGVFEISDGGVVTFMNDPDFEDPKDANQDNAYKIYVVAEDEDGLTGMFAVTITVTNLDEDGSVSLSTGQPTIGRPITATVSDPDGGVNDESWQWASSETAGGTFTDIEGATSATYIPRAKIEDNPATLDINEEEAGDEGMYLRARVTYRDAQSPDDDPDTPAEEGIRGAADDDSDRVQTVSDNAVRKDPDVNSDPEFDSATMMREVMENESTNAGDPVTATDADDDVITYEITGGADMDKFGINSTNGQITVGDDTKLNFEGTQTSYELEVTATDPFDGSGSTMVTLRVTDVNEMPVLENDFEEGEDNPADYEENGTDPVATFTATDPEGAGVEWAVEGTDAGKFDITGGVLTFKSPPNFEMPGDELRAEVQDDDTTDDIDESVEENVAGNNEYVLTVRVTEMQAEDDEGNAMSSAIAITVTVTDVNEPGMAEINLRQPEVSQNTPLNVIFSDPDVGQDPDSPTALGSPAFQWAVPKVSRPVTENDDHWQPAGAVANEVQTYTPVAGDLDKFLRVKVTYTDAAGTEMRSVYAKSEFATRAEQAGNQAPVFDDNGDYERTVGEDAASGTLVGAPVTSGDPNAADAGKLTYSIPTTADGAPFAINKATGQISVDGMLDHEAGDANDDGVYEFLVTATDPTGSTDTQTVMITARDVNEAPTVGLVTTGGLTEMLSVMENHAVEDDPAASPAVEAVDIGTYAANDLDAGDRVADGSAIDLTKVTLSLGGDDAAAFELQDADTDGNRVLRFASTPNFEMPTDANNDNSYKVSIIATDDEGLTGMRDITVTVTNVDEPGTVKLSHIQPGIGQELTATLTDEDGGINGAMWQWHSGETETGDFDPIEGATSASYTPKMTVPDNEDTLDVNEGVTGDEGMYLLVTVTYRDAQSMDDDEDTADVEEGRRGVDTDLSDGDDRVKAQSENAVREVPMVNNRPEFAAGITREVEENTPACGDVGDPVTASDVDEDALTYTISGGADMGAFDIDDETGQITVGAGTELDFEGSQTTYVIEIMATDPFGGSDSATVTITVTNMNEPPVLMLEGGMTTQPDEDTVGGNASRTVVEGDLTVGQYDTTIQNPTWSLLGVDAGDFSISGGALSFSSAPDYEAPTDANGDNVYMVTVVASNGGGQVADLAVTVTVVNDPSDDVTTPGPFDPLSYDADNDGSISKSEVLDAIDDYFDDMITKEQVLDVIDLYFGS